MKYRKRFRSMRWVNFACAMITCGFSQGALAQDGRERLAGVYVAPPYTQPAPDGSLAYITARFEFDGQRNRVLISAFADQELSQPLFTYESEGPIAIQGPSEQFQGGWNVVSQNDTSTVEIFVDAPPIWAALGLSDCPLALGTATEISACVDGGPFNISSCAEYDVLWLSADGASFRTGGGDVDRCEDYPVELGDIQYQRVE